MKWQIYYCYDAYCGWCYGFSPVIVKMAREYAHLLHVEVLSGGMILPDVPTHFSKLAPFIQKAYKTVEERTGIKFGEDYLWHVFNPDKTDWFPSSEKPAIALTIFKEYAPNEQVAFAADLQYSLHYEGRDLGDDEAYRHLLEKYNLPEDEFYTKLKSPEYKDKAYYEFALVKQLHVTGYPTVLLQASESKFYMIATGYTDYDTLIQNMQKTLEQLVISKEG